MIKLLRLWALVALSCLLAACGGGGGGPAKADQTPVAHALASGDIRMDGGVMHATVGGAVVLDASGSTDADGDSLNFAWVLTAHPAGSAVASNGSGSTLTWKPDMSGTYTFTVTVSDSKGGSSNQQVSVVVDNLAPVSSVTVAATFNAQPTQVPSQDVTVGGSIALDASATTDPDGDAVNVTFELVAPAGSTAALSVVGRTANLSPDVLGSYVVKVHGTDGRGASFETDYAFHAANRAPLGNVAVTPTFTATPRQMASTSVTVGANILLDAGASTDPDGDAVAVTFELTSPAGSSAAIAVVGKAAHFSPDVLGAYQVRVRGIDGRGASFETRYPFQADNRAPLPVTVASVNPVVANAGSTLIPTSVGYGVLIDSATSSDPDGDHITRNWVLASVPAGSSATLQGAATAASVGLSPDVLGDYVLNLTVTDPAGAQSVRTVTVRANNRRPVAQVTSNATPQALPNAPGILVPLGTTVTLRGDTSTDADGDALAYAWSIDTAPAGSHAALSSATAAAPTFTADVEGTFVFRLRVTDSHGAFSERSLILGVGTHPPVAVVDRGTVTVLAGSPAQASAALSYDPDGDSLTYQWSVDARPSGSHSVLAVASTAAVSFTPDQAGLYVLAVRVGDGHSTSIAYVNVRALGAFQPAVALDFVPGAAHYSLGLDRVVFGAATPSALHTVDPFTGARSAIPLPAAIKNFSLSPDGKLAAVLHEGVVTLVDLVNGIVLHSTSTGGSQTESLVTNAGIIYSIGQTGGQWVDEPVVVINGRTGVKIVQPSNFGFADFYGTQYGLLAGTRNEVFFISQGLSPSEIYGFSFDPVASQVTTVAGSPYWGNYPMYSPLWLASDDSLLFASSGDFFRTDTLAYAGQLSGVTSMYAFSHSASLQEALVLVRDVTTGGYPAGYLRFSGAFLFPDSGVALPTVGGHQAYGLNVFHSAAGSHVVLVQTGSNGVDGQSVTGYSLLAH